MYSPKGTIPKGGLFGFNVSQALVRRQRNAVTLRRKSLWLIALLANSELVSSTNREDWMTTGGPTRQLEDEQTTCKRADRVTKLVYDSNDVVRLVVKRRSWAQCHLTAFVVGRGLILPR